MQGLIEQEPQNPHPELNSPQLLPDEAVLLNLTGKDVAFLLRATRVLSESLDPDMTLATIARLSLPHLGSWCIVDLYEGEHMRRVAIIHPDPTMQSIADRLVSRDGRRNATTQWGSRSHFDRGTAKSFIP